jgi:hypothetical protein
MGKYKLIKTYPGSPELGETIIYDNDKFSFKSKYLFYGDPNCYPEFWEKVEEPLFKTEDGVNIYKGDTYYSISKDLTTELMLVMATGYGVYTNACVRFHSKMEALKYIRCNKKKPLFTTDDGVDVFEGDKIWVIHNHNYEIGSSYAVKNFTYKYALAKFSTKLRAEKWAENHKPQFSKEDLINFGIFAEATPLTYINEKFHSWLKMKRKC